MPDLEPNTGPTTDPLTGKPSSPPDPAVTPPGTPGEDPAGTTPPGQGEPPTVDVTSNGKDWAKDDSGKSLGFPKDTPNTEMAADEQVAYWKHHSRSWQRKAQNNKPEEVTALQARIDELERSKLSETEVAAQDALTAARESAAKEAEAFFLPKLQAMQLTGYAATLIGQDRAEAWAADTKHDQFVTEDGTVDGAKVVEYIKRVFAVGENTPPPPPAGTYMQAGQGHPGATTRLDPTQQSDAQLNKRFPPKQN